jgi:PhoPQ-activated pathogenicity-related protein
MGRMDDQNIHAMELLIDGYEYRERLRMPKVIISSTGDEFFMPDDSYNFFDDLLG